MVKNFNYETFNKDVIEDKGKVLVDFYADWCAPCKLMSPIVEAIAKSYDGQISVAKLNIDKSPNIASKYKVMSIPTLIYFENGAKVDSIVGLVDQAEIEDMIKRHL